MLGRPPAEGRHVGQRRYLLAFAAVFFLSSLFQVADAHYADNTHDARQQFIQQEPPIAPPVFGSGSKSARGSEGPIGGDAGGGDAGSGGPAGGRANGGSGSSDGNGRARHESPLEGDHVIRNLAATALTTSSFPDQASGKSTYTVAFPDANPNSKANKFVNKELYQNILIPDDASAIATLAPDQQSVRAPTPRRRSLSSSIGVGSGLQSQQTARRLEDWEVEDFVIMATVDGDLYASDRKTGKVRWHMIGLRPMVETIQHRANSSSLDQDYHPVDHYIWAVEPNRDGSLYLWMPESGTGLVRTGLTMKKLVEELAPFADEEPPVVYTGDKKTEMVTLDAATGRALKYFGSSGAQVNENDRCLRPSAPWDMESDECVNRGTITLGRTEYTVGIQRRDGLPIATLKYAEWVPNNFDYDLLQQYTSKTMDNRYITSQHDGRVYGFDLDRNEGSSPSFTEDFPAPVARVFDVARPWATPEGSNPDLVVLPQPPPPAKDDELVRRSNSIFLNQTQAGSWYALSGRSYPLILDAPEAQVNRLNWWERAPTWDGLDSAQISKALVGTHSLGSVWPSGGQQQTPTLPGPALPDVDGPEKESESAVPTQPTPDPGGPPSIIQRVRQITGRVAKTIRDFLTNPVLVILSCSFLGYCRTEIIRTIKRHFWALTERVYHLQPREPVDAAPDHLLPGLLTPDPLAPEALAPEANGALPGSKALTNGSTAPAEKKAVVETSEVAEAPATPTSTEPTEETSQPERRKKTHRGRRGGAKNRKNKLKQEDPVLPDDGPLASVDELVNNANKIGDNESGILPPEPDIQTLPKGVEQVSNPIIRLDDDLEVDEDRQLGTGSNGTIVYGGRLEGQPVAVKRMLRDFYVIASRETRLLRESDKHPNVIRYYVQKQRGNFIYIALELCEASLADVVEKAFQFRELAQAGQRDVQGILKQITSGLNHLHDLRIVHRDLKPQNILVNRDKQGRPLMLVSDFGLCKKLEGTQSSFGATTAHAAGTSGWRAPELLLDDDPRDAGAMFDAHSSTHSGNHSGSLVSPELLPNRRATRSIDIFSLGLIFYYVLTQGSHPFDCGGRYMREVNIRKGLYSLDKLDVLGDFKCEAKDLIGSMISANPKERPTTKEVMVHPFFWPAKMRLNFLCDVSDHFEKEPRDPPSQALQELERRARDVIDPVGGDFLQILPRAFTESLGKQRKYTGERMLDLLRALRNKKNHYEDMPESLKKTVGPLPDGYLGFWTRRFPDLLLTCWGLVYTVGWDKTDRFREYYSLSRLSGT